MQRMHRFEFQESPAAVSRRGAIVVWFIVATPVLLTLLCVMLEVANLYLARQELHNALEAAAQAAVKDWADNGGGDTLQSRIVGNSYALANTINGVPVDLSSIDPTLNYAGPGQPCNQNTCNSGVLVFGAITSDNPDCEFDC
jgi:Flp pilus assembly protein TadG